MSGNTMVIDVEDKENDAGDQSDTSGVTYSAAFTNTALAESSCASSCATHTFTVKLNSQPTQDVVVPVVSQVSPSDTNAATSVATVSPASMTFTSSNWNTPQTVTVTVVDDLENNLADRTATIKVGALTSSIETSTNTYNGVAASTITITATDNDSAGVVLTGIADAAVADNGGTKTFTVKLNSKPTADVTISVNSADTGVATVSHSSLVFTPSNWDSAQTVTVTAQDDSVDQTTDRTAIITVVTPTSSSDTSGYNGLAFGSNTFTLTATDDE